MTDNEDWMIRNPAPKTTPVFTDDDLKRLKETKEYWNSRLCSCEDLITPLLARLEAAEEVCEFWAHEEQGQGLIEAWREVAGK